MKFYELSADDIAKRLYSIVSAMKSLFTDMPECLDYTMRSRLFHESEEYLLATLRHFAMTAEKQLFTNCDMGFLEHIIFYWYGQPRVVHVLMEVLIADLSHLRNMPLERQANIAKVFREWRDPKNEPSRLL